LAYVIEPKDYLNFRLTGVLVSDPISQFWLLDAMQIEARALFLKNLKHYCGHNHISRFSFTHSFMVNEHLFGMEICARLF